MMPALRAWVRTGTSAGPASGNTTIALTLSVISVWMLLTCVLTFRPASRLITLSPSLAAAAVSAFWKACRTGWVPCGLLNPMVMPPLAALLAADGVAAALPPDALLPVGALADVHAASMNALAAAATAARAPDRLFTAISYMWGNPQVI